MKKTKRRCDREFEISAVADLLAQIAREHCIHASLPSWWRDELAKNPKKCSMGMRNKCKDRARIAELEKLLGQGSCRDRAFKESLRH